MLLVQRAWDHLRQLVTYQQPHAVMYFIPIALKNGFKMGQIVAHNVGETFKEEK